MSSSNRRKYDADATRTAILDAAQHVFVAKGRARASMSEIAKAAGVTKSLIHYHFGSKDELWTAAIQQWNDEHLESHKQVLAMPGEDLEVMKRAITTYFYFLKSHPDHVRFLSWTHLEPEVGQMPIEAFRMGLAKLEELQRRGVLRDDVPAVHMMACLTAACINWFETKAYHEVFYDTAGEWDPEESDQLYLDSVLAILIDGMRKR